MNKTPVFLTFFLFLAWPGIGWSADPAATSGGPAQAHVLNLVKETDLTTVVVTPEAEKRLGIKLVAIEKKVMPLTRIFAGEVVIPLSAPGASGTSVVLGGTLEERIRVAQLQAELDGPVEEATVQLEAAKVALERAQKLATAEVGSQRSLDEAKARLELAQATLGSAQARRELLGVPVDQAADSGRRWIRVSIYAGEVPRLDAKAAATIQFLSATAGSKPLSALPVKGPQTANALNATVEWYYELPATEKGAGPGERVTAAIPVSAAGEDQLVAPWNAVLHDIHGGQWVYERVGEHSFARRRVQVARVAGAEAILATGPAAGTKVVTDGAAELFGVEFGAGK